MSNHLTEKWAPILSHQDLPEIKDPYRRAVTAQLLENQESFLKEQAAMGAGSGLLMESPTMSVNAAGYQGITGGSVGGGWDGTLNADQGPRAGFDPVLISLIRRSMPNLIAYDICGVQPMSGPTGMIFAMRAMYDGPDGPNEALFNEPDVTFSAGADSFANGTQYNGYRVSQGLGTAAEGVSGRGKFVPAMADAYGTLVPWDGDPANKVVGYMQPSDSIGPSDGTIGPNAQTGQPPLSGDGWDSPFDNDDPYAPEYDYEAQGYDLNPNGAYRGPVTPRHPYVPGETPYNVGVDAYGNTTKSNANPGLLDDAMSPGGHTHDPNVAGQNYPAGGHRGEPTSPTYDPRLRDMAGMSKGQLERLGEPGNEFRQMGFSIEKAVVEARGRALKAQYSMELAQDLRAIHGLDAEAELANILSSEILAEINREIVRTVYRTALPGAQNNVNTPGVFDLDLDSNGRWSVEKFKGLLFQIERDCNAIAQLTRRGKGNMIICSADVASALTMAGVLDYTPALNANLNVDDTGNLFAGTINGKLKVYIDPYSANISNTHYYVVGYKGTSAYDAGLFYCPYIPLQMVRSVTDQTFQPNIGFKTRYGLIANPFAEGPSGPYNRGLGRLADNTNRYYRRVRIDNLM